MRSAGTAPAGNGEDAMPMRRTAAALLLALFAVGLPPRSARAQAAYPDRPVQVLVGWSPGAAVDLMARAVAEEMSRTLGPMIVVNRTGAAGTIASAAVANAAPDGYTLAAGPTHSINIAGHAMRSRPFGAASFEYVCQTLLNDFTIHVREGSAYASMPDLVAAMRAAPGKLTYGHLGPASIPNLAFAELLQQTGTTATGVAFRGDADVIPAVLSGSIDVGVSSLLSVLPQAGHLRVLAVFGERRSKALPNLPSLQEAGIRISPNRGLNGFMAPKGTPPGVLRKLRDACSSAMRSERVTAVAKPVQAGNDHLDGPEFGAAVEADYEVKGALIRRLGIEVN